ncbi:cell division protein FtsQ [Rhodococcus hoagii]|nr:cell division protein FtsQ [Prescottella equi]
MRSRPSEQVPQGSSVQVDSPEPAERSGRGSVDRARARSLRRKVFLIGGTVAVLIVALTATLWFSPLMCGASVEFVGDGVLSSEEVLAQAGIPGRWQATAAAAQRVAGMRSGSRRSRVRREYPSTVVVSVTERIPVVFFDSPEGTHLMDENGVDFAIEPPPFGVVRLVTPSPGRDDHATQAALEVLGALPESVRFQVSEVAAPTISSVSVTLVDGRVVVWGSADGSERKSAVVSVLLTQPGRIFDVSSPELPTVK